MGTKSFAMTVIVWLSMENCCVPSAPVLISRRRWVLPVWNLNLDRPALFVQGLPLVTVEQLKFILPLIRLLSLAGIGTPFGDGASRNSTMG